MTEYGWVRLQSR